MLAFLLPFLDVILENAHKQEDGNPAIAFQCANVAPQTNVSTP